MVHVCFKALEVAQAAFVDIWHTSLCRGRHTQEFSVLAIDQAFTARADHCLAELGTGACMSRKDRKGGCGCGKFVVAEGKAKKILHNAPLKKSTKKAPPCGGANESLFGEDVVGFKPVVPRLEAAVIGHFVGDLLHLLGWHLLFDAVD